MRNLTKICSSFLFTRLTYLMIVMTSTKYGKSCIKMYWIIMPLSNAESQERLPSIEIYHPRIPYLLE